MRGPASLSPDFDNRSRQLVTQVPTSSAPQSAWLSLHGQSLHPHACFCRKPHRRGSSVGECGQTGHHHGIPSTERRPPWSPLYLLRSFISLPVSVVFSAAFVRTSPEIYSLLAGVCHVFPGLEKLSAREAWPVWSISSRPGMPCSHLPQLSEPPEDIGDVSHRPDWHETSPCQGGPCESF